MQLSWIPPSNIENVVNISGYYVFYREFDSPPGKWDIAGVPNLQSKDFTLTDLKAFTRYRFRMTLAVTSGNGPASGEAVSSTKEGGKMSSRFALALIYLSKKFFLYIESHAAPPCCSRQENSTSLSLVWLLAHIIHSHAFVLPWMFYQKDVTVDYVLLG